VKSEFAPYYEVMPSEGGHSEFASRYDEDFEILKHAKEFVRTSENIENKKGKATISRVSVERVGAGPAIPLIYDYYRNKHPEMKKVLEETKDFNLIKGEDIIECAVKTSDPLCSKVVEKFTEIFAVETGNMTIKVLPFGGVYLVGGATQGIREYKNF